MRWQRLIIPAVVALVLTSGGWLAGQEQDKEKGPRGPGFGRRGDVLKFFAKKLGLDDKQMEKVAKIQEEYGPKVQRLQKELHEVQGREMKAFEQILTDDQKKQLTEMREMFNKKGPRKGPPPGAGAGDK